MSKRFTATEKWSDPWFCSLTERQRLFWVYLLDNCDNAGIWRANWILVELYFPGMGKALEAFKDRLVKIDGEKYHIPKFLEFQYGELSEACKPHLSVIRSLQKLGLWKSKGYTKGIHTLQDKDKDKEKDKEKGEGGAGGGIKRGKSIFVPFDEFYKLFPKHENKQEAADKWIALNPSREFWESTIKPSLLRHIESDSWKQENGKFIPNPAKWILRKRWEDEVQIKTEKIVL